MTLRMIIGILLVPFMVACGDGQPTGGNGKQDAKKTSATCSKDTTSGATAVEGESSGFSLQDDNGMEFITMAMMMMLMTTSPGLANQMMAAQAYPPGVSQGAYGGQVPGAYQGAYQGAYPGAVSGVDPRLAGIQGSQGMMLDPNQLSLQQQAQLRQQMAANPQLMSNPQLQQSTFGAQPPIGGATPTGGCDCEDCKRKRGY